MQFPVAVPNDGMVDLVIQGRVSSYLFISNACRSQPPPPLPRPVLSQLSRAEMLRGFDGAENGAPYWQDKVSVFVLDLPAIPDHPYVGTILQS